MSMFDNFFMTLGGSYCYSQSKDFSCDMENFHLGDMVDKNQHGLGFAILSHHNDIAMDCTVEDSISSNYNSNRSILCILHDGRWIDYAIYDSIESAKASMPVLKKYLRDPSVLLFIYKALQRISLGKVYASSLNESSFSRDWYIFGKRKEKIHGKFFFTKSWPSRRTLTLKWLSNVINLFFQSSENNQKKSEFYTWSLGDQSHHRADTFTPKRFNKSDLPWYHYDGPDFPADSLSRGLTLSNISSRTSLLIDRFASLDLKFFEDLSAIDLNWADHSSKEFKNFVRKNIHLLLKSRVLSFAWLSLRESFNGCIQLSKHESLIDINPNKKVDLLVYLTSYLEVDEVYLSRVHEIHPEIFNIKSFEAFIPYNYEGMLKKLDINDKHLAMVDAFGTPYLHRISLISLSHAQGRGKTKEILDRFKKSGVDMNSVDKNGNTPFMYCLKTLSTIDASQRQMFFGIFIGQQLQNIHNSFFDDMFLSADLSVINKDGKSAIDIFPDFIIKPESYTDIVDRLILSQNYLNKNNATQTKRKSV
jgi:hypothetical protein